ncbi:acyl-CoA thioesterase [Streptomyces prunicolor]|uniref:Acyl-CoA thioesterase II n=1 Tax=Streptomyces prunicolor TaxID=67348 RepID=A0ABU4FDF1_9ACTN|nr:acyl-CoA thioesterase II [Streptomyces prunicolor]MCX5240382.1 acyl-CoA thioesterase II [Streptomyces prunicolor]MDV7218063.1 acyl-CoA thioesterase II [Streptomyces prunicolor]
MKETGSAAQPAGMDHAPSDRPAEQAEGHPPDLDGLFDLHRWSPSGFRAVGPNIGTARLFGGQAVAQALCAAGRTVPEGFRANSLHAHFLRSGETPGAVEYRVEIVRNGTTFATRRVAAVQQGTELLQLTASFHRPEPGLTHQTAVLDVPDPESLPTPEESLPDARGREWYRGIRARFPFDMRFVGAPPGVAAGTTAPPRHGVWFRAREPLGADPLLHACTLALVSDLFLLAAALPPHGLRMGTPGMLAVSLDHAVWFHDRAFRGDDWFFCAQEGSWAGGGRALCRSTVFDRRGTLVATVAQEGLIRVGPQSAR